ncbi:hypothetical protein NQZ68_025780 [Dissostichus eleginoides]|nr:hypothetical protein NQZ68_025780 [Dissostichus eleginoides]
MIRARGQIKHPLDPGLGNELIAKPMTWPTRHESPHRAGPFIKTGAMAEWQRARTDVAGGRDGSAVPACSARQRGGEKDQACSVMPAQVH